MSKPIKKIRRKERKTNPGLVSIIIGVICILLGALIILITQLIGFNGLNGLCIIFLLGIVLMFIGVVMAFLGPILYVTTRD